MKHTIPAGAPKSRKAILASVLILVVVLSVMAEASHRSAWRELKETERVIESVLDEIHPRMAAMLLEEFSSEVQGNESFAAYVADQDLSNLTLKIPELRYRGAGGTRTHVRGGVVNGPSTIEFTVVLSTDDPATDYSVLPIRGSLERVNVTIECVVPWRLFAGQPLVGVTDNGAPHNKRFIEMVVAGLEEAGVEIDVEG